MVVDLGKDVAMVRVFHDYVKFARLIMQKSLFVLDDIGMIHTGEYPNLIYCIVFLLLAEFWEIHLLEGVDLLILFSFDLEYLRVGSITDFFNNLEILKFGLSSYT